MKYLITLIGAYIAVRITGISEVLNHLAAIQQVILGILFYFIYKSGQMDYNVVITKEE